MRNLVRVVKVVVPAVVLLVCSLVLSPALTQPTYADCKDLSTCDLITDYVKPTINLLVAVVGIGAVISIIVGGIQYSSSGGNPQKSSAAKDRIRNSVIGLLAFLFLYAMLNFLVPGGVK